MMNDAPPPFLLHKKDTPHCYRERERDDDDDEWKPQSNKDNGAKDDE
jgi:hypothetical protein